jgi:hypothetical protein
MRGTTESFYKRKYIQSPLVGRFSQTHARSLPLAHLELDGELDNAHGDIILRPWDPVHVFPLETAVQHPQDLGVGALRWAHVHKGNLHGGLLE